MVRRCDDACGAACGEGSEERCDEVVTVLPRFHQSIRSFPEIVDFRSRCEKHHCVQPARSLNLVGGDVAEGGT